MRIACLQFAPKLGDIDNNLNRADAVLSKANPGHLDLLVLPELAFTGYNFKSLQAITPYLEPKGSGITSLWARTVALKYDCVVCAGYPEKVDVSRQWPTSPEFYNSTMVINGDGETIANYRKSFLFTDDSWALEGTQGFFADIIPGLGNTTLGICMDINPYKFEAPWHAFEFAYHVLDSYSNLVIVTMAWITREDGQQYSQRPYEPDMETLTYWVTRFEPLIRTDNDDEIIIVFCNRTGTEGDATYTGTSAVLGIHDGEVKVYGLLGRGEKTLLVVDTHNPPRAKMVYRPEGGQEEEQNEASSEHLSSSGHKLKPNSSGNHERPSAERERSRSRYEKAPLSPSPPAPPPPPSDEREKRSSSRRRRERSKSKRKELSVRVERPEAPGAEEHNIPTPSAPSPTPLAVRPKLVIPDSSKSPISPPLDDFMGPPSAISMLSESSMASTAASLSTVRSLTRPPEDSTPYPHSSLPSSVSPFSPKRHIYSGTVHWGGVSVRSPEHFPYDQWSPRAEQSGRGESFPWPPEQGGFDTAIPRGEDEENRVFTWDQLRKEIPTAEARERNAAARRSLVSHASTDRTSKFFAPGSSPHSRSTSRSRKRDSGPPAAGMMDPIVAFAQQTAHLIPGSDAMERIRALSGEDSPVPDRPSSPKSRNASRNRNIDTPDRQRSSSAVLTIGASPSVFGGDGRDSRQRGRQSAPHNWDQGHGSYDDYKQEGH